MKRSAQNLVEFVFVMPMLLFIIFVVIELAFYWRAVHTVQNIADQAALRAATAIVTSAQTATSINEGNQNDNDRTHCSENDFSSYSDSVPAFNCAAALAYDTLLQRQVTLAISLDKYNLETDSDFGDAPYTLYKFTSEQKIDGDPMAVLYVNYQDPYKEGIVVQLVYQYPTLFGKFSIVGIPIMPGAYEISSTKVKSHSHY